MLNIYDLEQRWKIYKIKSSLPYIFTGISLIIIILLGYYFYLDTKKQITKKTKVTITEPLKIAVNKKPLTPQPTLQIQKIQPTTLKIKKEPAVTMTIERKETKNDIYKIIKRFEKTNNPALSLFIAKKYYVLGNYKQSYNYALLTNQIDPNIEASWILFAQSLVKLHQKSQAIHTLQKYIKVSHSKNAEILLNEITSGKI